jgi:ABC-type uncharacterized transport system ATPase subunit
MENGSTAKFVRDLHKSYGNFEAVRGIDFEVQTGEVFGLLGPDGAGKHRALGEDHPHGVLRFWIGSHAHYDQRT